MKLKHQRLLLISSALVGFGIAAWLILIAFQESLVFFYTPSDLLHKHIFPQQRIRVGGLVKFHSVHSLGKVISFEITDPQKSLYVTYQGLLPDLFREGQGVIVEGHLLNPTNFQAETVLAKHDETYMPQEVVDRLKQSGLWRNAE